MTAVNAGLAAASFSAVLMKGRTNGEENAVRAPVSARETLRTSVCGVFPIPAGDAAPPCDGSDPADGALSTLRPYTPGRHCQVLHQVGTAMEILLFIIFFKCLLPYATTSFFLNKQIFSCCFVVALNHK